MVFSLIICHCIEFFIVNFFEQEQIAQLKSKMASNAKECEERNRQLKEASVLFMV